MIFYKLQLGSGFKEEPQNAQETYSHSEGPT